VSTILEGTAVRAIRAAEPVGGLRMTGGGKLRTMAAVLLWACWGAFAAAQEDEVVTSLSARVDGFFANLADGTVVDKQSVFDDLLAGGPLADRPIETGKLVEEFESLPGRYGRYLRVERLSAKRAGKDLIFLKYLYKCESSPVVWYFTFYRPKNGATETAGWVIISLRFDTRLDLLELGL
jgi:hypothetical protein